MSSSRNLFKNQDYYKIRKNCLQNNRLFEDDFFEIDNLEVDWLRPGKIVRNPMFIVEGGSKFDVVRNNNNSWMTNAMASLTMNKTFFQHVVPHEQNFKDKYVGIFFFRIWQCGEWVEVVVDDRLATKEGKLVNASSKQKNEFWSALLEKAYAKLYGSYENLTRGLFSKAMIDFTGGITEQFRITKMNTRNLTNFIAEALRKGSFMTAYIMDDDPVLEAKLASEGIRAEHLYAINRLINYCLDDLSSVLIRLKSPSPGKSEWTGAWSDSSREWNKISEHEKKKIGLVNEQDGEFWMSMIDFAKHFQFLDIIHLSPAQFQNSGSNERIGWEAHSFKGEWIKGVNAGGFVIETFHLNPQYRITLTDADDDNDDLCTVVIALMQKNTTRYVMYHINFTAFLLDGPEKYSKERLSEKYIKENFKNSKSSEFSDEKEIVVREKWVPGVYCIIPSTRYPGQEGQYLLRVFSEKKALIEEGEEYMVKIGSERPKQVVKEDRSSIGKTLLQKNDHEIEEFFNKIAGEHCEIGWEELQLVLDYALGNVKGIENDVSTETGGIVNTLVQGIKSWLTLGSWWSSKPSTDITFSKDKCRRLIKMLDDDFSGKLGPMEFKVLWKRMKEWESVFLNHCKEEKLIVVPELKPALLSAGYTINNCDLGRLARRYSDNNQQLGFDDFIMCVIEAETGWI